MIKIFSNIPVWRVNGQLVWCSDADRALWWEHHAKFWRLVAIIELIMIILLIWVNKADAQGIYMGRDGRVHAQVIVDPYGRGWPVIPTPCFGGPCPVLLAPPMAPPPMSYAPAPPLETPPPPPPPPLGWIYGPYTICADPPRCSAIAVAVGADGLNVRTAPNGPVITALANGTPLIPFERQGNWVLIAPGCALAPTWTWSVTTGLPLSVCL